jgi:hypothetical protein
LERIILNNIDAQFLHLRALPGITADGAIRRRVPGTLIDKDFFFNVFAATPGGRMGVYANDITK